MIERDFEVHLRRYSDLYVQIGVLEKLLRVTIPRSQAHKDRNFIAHYNTSAIKGVDASLENVRWLQRAMGLVEAK